ncbi:MAG: radical SAM protein [Candidatus Bathyarchaeia archaeon]
MRGMWRLARPDASAALDDPRVRRSMPRYVDIVKGSRLAKFLIAKSMPSDFDPEASDRELWRLHSRLLERYGEIEGRVDGGSLTMDELDGGASFLDLKVELARRVMTSCHFCVRRCGVDRLAGGRGYCQCGVEFMVSSCFPHLGEEPELVPSGTIFTCGCSMRCLHCQNWGISQWREPGTPAGPSKMAEVVGSLRRQGCRNVNMVGGDPTPNCWLWLRTMLEVDVNVATVWNSNSYYSQETAELLAGFIDLYLLDFKYGNNRCAAAISDAPGYWEACTRNHLMAERHGELIIRVLVLPEHNECCTRPILEWIAENLGPWTRVNVMFQYRPEWRAHERKELRRRLTRREMREALRIAEEVGLRNLVHQ